LTYFFDENISYRHANMLRALGEEVVHISKARGFRRSDPDTVWMPKVASEGWTAVTLDVSILRVVVERYVRSKSGLRVVFLAEGFRNKVG
jgi:PIN like domain